MRHHREARVIDLWLNVELKVESDEGLSDFGAKLKFYEDWPERFMVFKGSNKCVPGGIHESGSSKNLSHTAAAC